MTSISDRCKTAREGAAPGPWIVGNTEDPNDVFVGQKYCNCCPENPALYGEVVTRASLQDAALVALAPEAADEVVRLTDALEDLAEWHLNRANAARDDYELTEHYAVAGQLRSILNPNGDLNE